MMRRWFVATLMCGVLGAATLGSTVAWAVPTVALDGTFSQGGLVIGQTDPGAEVSIDGQTVPVSARGVFMLGFGRDAKAQARLVVALGQQKSEQVLTIKQRDFPVQRIEGLPTRKVTPAPEDIARIKDDNRQIWAVRESLTDADDFLSGFDWPVLGPISGVFGSQRILNGKPRNPHNGVDVAAPLGTVVRAPAAGIVRLVHDDMFYTGKTLMIDHGWGLTSVYAHMDSMTVISGARVEKGTPIGTIGKTGRATGAHLHWGVTLSGIHLDPQLLTGPMPSKK